MCFFDCEYTHLATVSFALIARSCLPLSSADHRQSTRAGAQYMSRSTLRLVFLVGIATRAGAVRSSISRRKLSSALVLSSATSLQPSVAPANALTALRPASGRIAGGKLPVAVGLGTCLVRNGQAPLNVGNAISEGYRIFDTAQRYDNEAGVGQAIRTAISKQACAREELFVTTKVWVDNMGLDKTPASVRASAESLGLDTIDLVLIHWPGQFKRRGDGDWDRQNADLRRGTWEALEELKREGLVSNIGLANFSERHLRELLAYAKVQPSVNQIEVHPYNTRESLVKLCAENGIVVNSYCPLGGRGNKGQVTDQLLGDKLIKEIASAHAKTPAQTILRWHLQRGLAPIPKASSKAHLRENIQIYDDFELSSTEMSAMNHLNRNQFALFDADALA